MLCCVQVDLRQQDRRRSDIAPGAAAIIFDETKERVLLTRRSDIGRWCLPGGGMDPGESAQETFIRETLEKTGPASWSVKPPDEAQDCPLAPTTPRSS